MRSTISREQIVDAALRLAAQHSWESLRLHQLAAELGISLNDIRAHFREKEDIVDAWFDRADRAMLDEGSKPEVVSLDARRRLHRLLMTWLGTLTAHKTVTRQMVANKLEPGHLHYQLGGLLRISRTVQWWREAAGRDASLPRRAFEETILTGAYLATFARWMTDATADDRHASALLERLLAGAERLERRFMSRTSLP